MVREPLPRSLKKAIERLEAEPERPWRLCDLASAFGVSSRTLQKHFRRFLGCPARIFLGQLRFEPARRELIGGCEHASVTEIATRTFPRPMSLSHIHSDRFGRHSNANPVVPFGTGSLVNARPRHSRVVSPACSATDGHGAFVET